MKRRKAECREQGGGRACGTAQGGFLESMDTDTDPAAAGPRSPESGVEKRSSDSNNPITTKDQNASAAPCSPLKKLRKTVRELNSSPQEASICNPTISSCTNLCKQESSIIIKHSEHFVENEEQQVVKSEFEKFSSGAVNNSLTDQDTKLTSADNSQERGCQVLATSDSDDTRTSNLASFQSSIKPAADSLRSSSASASDVGNPPDKKPVNRVRSKLSLRKVKAKQIRSHEVITDQKQNTSTAKTKELKNSTNVEQDKLVKVEQSLLNECHHVVTKKTKLLDRKGLHKSASPITNQEGHVVSKDKKVVKSSGLGVTNESSPRKHRLNNTRENDILCRDARSASSEDELMSASFLHPRTTSAQDSDPQLARVFQGNGVSNVNQNIQPGLSSTDGPPEIANVENQTKRVQTRTADISEGNSETKTGSSSVAVMNRNTKRGSRKMKQLKQKDGIVPENSVVSNHSTTTSGNNCGSVKKAKLDELMMDLEWEATSDEEMEEPEAQQGGGLKQRDGNQAGDTTKTPGRAQEVSKRKKGTFETEQYIPSQKSQKTKHNQKEIVSDDNRVASGNHTSSRQVSDDQGEIKGKADYNCSW